MANRKKPIELEYFKYLKEESNLSARDIQEIFGFKNTKSVSLLVSRKQFPKHDLILKKKGSPPLYFWKRNTVMDAIKKFNELLIYKKNG